jgi:hypothetical protein
VAGLQTLELEYIQFMYEVTHQQAGEGAHCCYHRQLARRRQPARHRQPGAHSHCHSPSLNRGHNLLTELADVTLYLRTEVIPLVHSLFPTSAAQICFWRGLSLVWG